MNATSVNLSENLTWHQNLAKARFSTLAFGDINNDTRPDLILTGCTAGGANDCEGAVSKIYINNGTSLYENSTWQANLTGVGWSSTALGDIDNDADLDLVVIGCTNASGLANCNGVRVAKVYINNGTSLLENSSWQQELTALWQGSLALGDLDNDGDLDLVAIGVSTSLVAKVYINNGTALVENSTWQGSLTARYRGGIALADVDIDSYLDLILTGQDDLANTVTKIYINNRTSLYENTTWQQSLQAGSYSASIWGDFDNNGKIDLFWIGTLAGDHLHIYNNTGTSLASYQNESGTLAGIYNGGLTLGDYDNDGDLDLAATGKEGYTYVYENNASKQFRLNSSVSANLSQQTQESAIVWTDINNDSNLDLILVGLNSTLISKVYTNNISANTAPNASTSGFSSTYSNNKVTLVWGAGADAETPTNGLYYNLRIGSSTQGHQIVSGVYSGTSGGGGAGGGASGYFGNMMQRRNITLSTERLSGGGTYYWSVQTVDTGLKTSAWSTEQTFTLQSDITPPSVTLNSPAYFFNTSNTTLVFNVTASDNIAVSNVSLYGNWTGTWILNHTNTSWVNNTAYNFTKNLSTNGDGRYIWAVRVNDTSNNSIISANRTFTIDTKNATIYLMSPANGSTQTSNPVTFTYNVTDLTLSSCALYIGGTLDQNSTSVTERTSLTFSKTMSNGNYNWFINCTDSIGFSNVSETYNLTVSVSSGGGTSGGGGGGGAGGVSLLSESKVLGKIPTGTPALVVFAKPEQHYVRQISLTPKSEIANAVVKVTKLNDRPANVPDPTKAEIKLIETIATGMSTLVKGKSLGFAELNTPRKAVFSYLTIEPINFKSADLEKVEIQFLVNKSWLTKNEFSDNEVYLLRYSNNWQKLESKKTGSIGEQLIYKAQSPGLSTFAIYAEEKVLVAEGKPEIAPEEKAPTKIKEITEKREVKKETPTLPYGIVVLIIVVLIVIPYAFLRKGKSL